MQILRTPDTCFANLPDFPWPPTYREIEDAGGNRLRIASVEVGPSGGPVVLMMHGEPSWSFLYRTMIPLLVDAGCRVLAPDLVGFGRSDKPAAREDYTYARHIDWMQRWLDATGVQDITLVCQDWGGLIGLRLLAAAPERFCAVVAANTFLLTGDFELGEAFHQWKHFSQTVPVFPAGKIVQAGTASKLPAEVVAAYDAPFPDPSYSAGAREFPNLVPITPDDPESAPNRAAWDVLERFDKPFITAFSDQDPVSGGAERIFQTRIPGCAGQPHVTLHGGGHFLQEDVGPQLAGVVVGLLRR